MKCMLKECKIGKARDNLVQLRGWTVSGLHAEIQQTREGLYVNHLCGDSSKTLVNGNKVDSYGPLKEEDIISIGSYEISALSLDGDMTSMTNISLIASIVDKTDSGDEREHKVSSMPPIEPESTLDEEPETDDPDEEEEEEQNKPENRPAVPRAAPNDARTVTSSGRTMSTRNCCGVWICARLDIGRMSDEDLRAQVSGMIVDIIGGFKNSLPSYIEEDRLATDVLNEAVGLGPLESLLADDSVTEVMVNAFDDIYVERNGKLTKSDVHYSSHSAVLSAIERIVSPLGRRIDESSPMVDGAPA